VVIDADGNGWSDIIVTRSDGVWLHSNQGGVFDTEKLPLELPEYTTPLSVAIADLNRDGREDLIVSENYIGLAPQKLPLWRAPGRLLLQTASGEFAAVGAEAGYLNVRLPDHISSLGARATLSLSDGSRQVRYFTSGEGLCADSSHVLSFGLGEHSADLVSIQYIDGTFEQLTGSFRNELLVF
jgi:hypothetical protein